MTVFSQLLKVNQNKSDTWWEPIEQTFLIMKEWILLLKKIRLCCKEGKQVPSGLVGYYLLLAVHQIWWCPADFSSSFDFWKSIVNYINGCSWVAGFFWWCFYAHVLSTCFMKLFSNLRLKDLFFDSLLSSNLFNWLAYLRLH